MNEITKEYFLRPTIPKQKQYEALRTYFVEGVTQREAAERFGYTLSTFQTLVKIFKAKKLIIFASSEKGPKERQTPLEIREKIKSLRNENFSIEDIYEKLKEGGFYVSLSTIGRILRDYGFGKLPRRTREKLRLTKEGMIQPEKSRQIVFEKLTDARYECQVAGIYLFIPYILESKFHELIMKSSLPETEQLSKLNYAFSTLVLKLIGQERLSQVGNYSFDKGFGFFAGVNVLPKATAISTYSYLIDKKTLMDLQKEFVSSLNRFKPDYYSGKTINLDFHTIPHYGENPPLDYNWVGSKNKAMRGALTFFAQDGDSKMISYANTDIKRSKASYEILNFVDYWISVKGLIDQTLVFDSRLTNYRVLNELNESHVKFITLRRKGKKLIQDVYSLPPRDWSKVKLDIPKRKYNTFWAYDHEIKLNNYESSIREIIIKGHGREHPTFVITNNFDLPLLDVVLYYARRWRIENKISELVSFFNLNALSSPFMIRIFYDVFMTMIAEICYRMLAEDLPRFENHTAKDIFGKFVNYHGEIMISGDNVIVKARKRATTPILKSSPTFKKVYDVPWWNHKKLKFVWTP